jgi:hypothetical protein
MPPNIKPPRPLPEATSMFDHIINFSSEAAALTEPVIAAYYDEESGTWRGDSVIPGAQVYRIAGYQTITDPDSGESYQQEIRQHYPGWFALIGDTQVNDDIRNLPLGNCMLICDRYRAAAGDPDFLVFVSPTLSQDDLNMLHIEPAFAGSGYDFAVSPSADSRDLANGAQRGAENF